MNRDEFVKRALAVNAKRSGPKVERQPGDIIGSRWEAIDRDAVPALYHEIFVTGFVTLHEELPAELVVAPVAFGENLTIEPDAFLATFKRVPDEAPQVAAIEAAIARLEAMTEEGSP